MNFSDIVTALDSEIASLQQTTSLSLVLLVPIQRPFGPCLGGVPTAGSTLVTGADSPRVSVPLRSGSQIIHCQISLYDLGKHGIKKMASNPEADVN
jgi:hypothetical protein